LSHTQKLESVMENGAAVSECYGSVMVEASKQNMPVKSAKSW
jgi:hypothetical protein